MNKLCSLLISICLLLSGCSLRSTQIPTETPTRPTATLVPTETSSPPTATLTPSDTPLPPTPTLDIGSTRIGKDGMTLLYVPSGKFIMGAAAEDAMAECKKFSLECDLDLFKDEEPPHTVELDAFWIDKTEVTKAMYAQCVQDGKCDELGYDIHYDDSAYANHPIVDISWSGANIYCAWAGRRLPTEAEWEKAARGTDGRTYPWGNNPPNKNLSNFNYAVGDTTEVGKYPDGASPYGALDMAGNVDEWVADWYDEHYYATLEENASNPQGPASGEARVLRGGWWADYVAYIRSTDRSMLVPDIGGTYAGFRCAMSATP